MTVFIKCILQLAEDFEIDIHEALFLLISFNAQNTEDITELIRFNNSGKEGLYAWQLITVINKKGELEKKLVKKEQNERITHLNLVDLLNKNLIAEYEFDQDLKTFIPELTKTAEEYITNLYKENNLQISKKSQTDLFQELLDIYPMSAILENGNTYGKLKVKISPDLKEVYINNINSNEKLHKEIIAKITGNLVSPQVGNSNLVLSLENFVRSKYWEHLEVSHKAPIKQRII